MATTSARPRCPHAVHGLDSAAMRACPGFTPIRVPVGADRVVGTGVSCVHLVAQRDLSRPGAYVSGCAHPRLGLANGASPVSSGR